MAEATPVVGIIMGSESDMPAMEPCMAQLDAMGVPYEVKVASAHRKPAVVHEWAETAHDRGIKVIIAAAGKAAHLGGVVAAFTPLIFASGTVYALTFLISMGVAALCALCMRRFHLKWLGSFIMSISLIVSMAASVLLEQIF